MNENKIKLLPSLSAFCNYYPDKDIYDDCLEELLKTDVHGIHLDYIFDESLGKNYFSKEELIRIFDVLTLRTNHTFKLIDFHLIGAEQNKGDYYELVRFIMSNVVHFESTIDVNFSIHVNSVDTFEITKILDLIKPFKTITLSLVYNYHEPLSKEIIENYSYYSHYLTCMLTPLGGVGAVKSEHMKSKLIDNSGWLSKHRVILDGSINHDDLIEYSGYGYTHFVVGSLLFKSDKSYKEVVDYYQGLGTGNDL